MLATSSDAVVDGNASNNGNASSSSGAEVDGGNDGNEPAEVSDTEVEIESGEEEDPPSLNIPHPICQYAC